MSTRLRHRQDSFAAGRTRTMALICRCGWWKFATDATRTPASRLISSCEARRGPMWRQLKVKVDLDVKTYDYLRTTGIFCPRLLVVLIMPADEADWLSQSPNELAIRHCAYWLSLASHPATTGARTVRVAIPLANIFSWSCARSCNTSEKGKNYEVSPQSVDRSAHVHVRLRTPRPICCGTVGNCSGPPPIRASCCSGDRQKEKIRPRFCCRSNWMMGLCFSG